MQHIGFLSLKKFQLEFSGLKKTIVLSKMNMNKRKVYVVPEVRIVEVCQENLMTILRHGMTAVAISSRLSKVILMEEVTTMPNGMVLMCGKMILSIDNVLKKIR